jgi:hypothetical protein
MTPLFAKIERRLLLFGWIIPALLISTSLFAQLGPGGVSHETPNTQNPTQSDVRLWLDAGSLINKADGDPVDDWPDISHSAINDKGFRQSNDDFLPPYFRDDPSASINGYPVLTFEEGRMLKVNSSNDLNTSIQTTYEQTIIMAFRTSDDVTSRQTIWEEGGGWRGMNIFINNGEIHLGAYDKQPDNDPGSPNVPPFGYNYVKTPIQPNTTYVLSHVFYAPTNNSLNGYVQGYQNGSFFGTLINGGQYNAGIGGVFRHPDPIGIGAVNSDSFNENGPVGNQTGTQAFKGRLAEICYYNRLLNDAERIIVENYLGAKYYANIIVNDRYEYQANYGTGVIGIGQTSNSPSTRHDVSQGYNPFEISPANSSISFNSTNEFLLVGHNDMSMNLTDENVPNDPGSTERTERIWRFDETNELSVIKFRFHEDDLPTLPAGFTKHILIFDNNSPNFPDFSTSNATIYELENVGGGFYEVETDVQDGAFMTIGVLKPQVSFRDEEAFALESDPTPDSTAFVNKIYARLNYVPVSPVTVDYSFTDGTATRANDYGYLNGDIAAGATFPPGVQEVPIRIWVKNDVLAENPSTESFTVNLFLGPNTTPGIGLGSQAQHTFTIYDNDPPPKLSFAQASGSILESAGPATLEVVRTGSTSGSATARIRVISSGTTASTDDYSYPTYKTVSFSPGESVKSVDVDITSDELDEFDENIRFQLYNIVGAGTEPSSILLRDLTIQDDDLPPTVEFTSPSSQNYETTGVPLIYIELDKPSAKDVTVTYTKNETLGTAANEGPDYGLAYPVDIIIPAGDTLGFPVNFIVQQDGIDEDDETVEFEITGAVNASLGTNTEHIYTIKDYSAFEWKGVAGVGKDSDNILWINIDGQSGSHNSQLQTLTNFSPHNINITQNSGGRRGRLQTTSNLINGRKTFRFDGNDDYHTIDNSGLINLAPYVVNKSYFMVIRTGTTVNGWHTIYKQGGGSRGLAIYIYNGDMYFHAWNNPNDGPEAPWGSGSGPTRYARFDNVQPNTNYVVSCIFDKDATQKLRIYVNGVLGSRAETGTCGRIYTHSGAVSIGGNNGSSRYHDNSSTGGRFFNGYLAELIHFNDAPVNETRRRIIENYLSGKYNIPLNANQIIDVDPEYDNDIAGIGQLNDASDDLHRDSQGKSILRIKGAQQNSNGSFMFWGHNNVALDETWPWSSGSLPSGVVERSGRVWKISKTGSINNVEILIRYQNLLNATTLGLNDLKLLVHSNPDGQDFSGATVVDAAELMSGYVARFDNVSLQDGDFFALANSNIFTPLPIELLDFSARLNGNVVNLNWTTLTETNNDYFVVERAKDNLNWESVLVVPGAGNSTSLLSYSEADREPLEGISYYRLKQVDYDGTFSYSDIVSVLNTHNGVMDEISIFPNPSSLGIVFVRLGRDFQDTPIDIRIYDLSGKLYISKTLEPNGSDIQLNCEDLPPGMYLTRISSAHKEVTRKLVIH